jgi:O-antigen ligase
MPEVERAVPLMKIVRWYWEGFRMRTDARSRASQAPTLLKREMAAAQVSAANRPTAENAANTERVLLWAFIAGLAWCPFWFGGAILLAWGINAVLFPGLVVIYELSLLIRGARHPVAIRQIKLPAALFAAVVLWILIQNATWIPDWMHHPIWQMTADALGRPVEGSISVDRELTSLALLRLVTAASVFWLALQLCRDVARANLLLQSIAAIICAYAIYGLVAAWVTPGRVLWFKNSYTAIWPHGVVTSTFVNPDSFSAYAGTGFVLFCGLILRFYRDEVAAADGSIRFRIASFIEVTGKRGLVLFAGAGATLIALLLTASRGGIAATAFGLCVLGALTLWRRKQRFAQRAGIVSIIIIIVGGSLLVGAVFLFFGDLVLGKFSQGGFRDPGRVGLYVITMRSILAAPWLGYGYGTFVDVFPMFRDQSVTTYGQWTAAHDTYLEVFQGLGLIFGPMLVASVAVLVWRCSKGAATRQTNDTVPCVAAAVACLLGAHALVDFTLQLQAIAITFMALLGAGVAQAASSRLIMTD